MVKDQKAKEDLDEIVDKMIDERIEKFKILWNDEKEAEVEKLKELIDNRLQELEESNTKNRGKFEKEFLEKVTQQSNEDRESKIRQLEDKLQDRIKKEIELSEGRGKEKSETEMEKHLTCIRKEIKEAQEKLGSELRNEFDSGFGKLKAEIEKELGRVKEESQKRNDNIEPESPRVQKGIAMGDPSEHAEEEFEIKMQSEMKQMKEKLKQDFSREVQALEDEIEALRNTYDSKVYTTDEGKNAFVLKSKIKYDVILKGLGLSRSRLRMNEESSDDELGKIIKQRQKKLQKSKMFLLIN